MPFNAVQEEEEGEDFIVVATVVVIVVVLSPDIPAFARKESCCCFGEVGSICQCVFAFAACLRKY